MALTTRANVLQELGLTDDATEEGVIAVTFVGTGSGSISFPSLTTMKLNDNGSDVLTIDFTATDADTLSKVVTRINTTTNFQGFLVDGVDGNISSTLINASTEVILPDGESEHLTYTNSAAGTNAAIIDRIISEVEGEVGRYCGRFDEDDGTQTFESGTRTETYDGTGSNNIVLRNAPVSSITSVKHIDDSGNETTLSATSYRVSKNGILHKLSGDGNVGFYDEFEHMSTDGPRRRMRTGPVWCRGFRNYEVVYVAGYSSVPSDLEGVVIDICCDAYLNRRENRELGQHQAGGQTVQRKPIAELVALRKHRLSPYVRGSGVIG